MKSDHKLLAVWNLWCLNPLKNLLNRYQCMLSLSFKERETTTAIPSDRRQLDTIRHQISKGKGANQFMAFRHKLKHDGPVYWKFLRNYCRPAAISLRKVEILEDWHADWCAIYRGRKCNCNMSMPAPAKRLRANID